MENKAKVGIDFINTIPKQILTSLIEQYSPNNGEIELVVLYGDNFLRFKNSVDAIGAKVEDLGYGFGILIIKGSDLHLNRFSLDNTELSVEGEINSLSYSDKKVGGKNESVFSKIFK